MAALDQYGNPIIFGVPPQLNSSFRAASTNSAAPSPLSATQTSASTATPKAIGTKRSSSSINTSLSDSTQPPTKRIKFKMSDFGDMVKMFIRPYEIETMVPRKLACAESKFLAATFAKDLESAGADKVIIAEHGSMSISIFVNWLQKGDVDSLQEYTNLRSDSQDESKVLAELDAQWNALADCFKLGEYLVAPNFKNAVMNAIVSKSKEIHERGSAAGLTSTQLNDIYNGTKNSPLRKLVLHTMLVSDVEKIMDGLDTSVPKIQEFLKDVAKLSVARLQGSISTGFAATSEEPWKMDPCVYHDHPDQEEGFSCTKK